MKTKIKLIIALSVLALIVPACSMSFTTANISSFNFGKNDTGNPPATSFDVGEKVYAVASISNAMGKYKLKYKLTTPSSPTPVEKDLNFEGNYRAFLELAPTMPGEFKVEVILYDESGKEIDKKSGSFTAKGSAPAPAETKKDDAGSGDPDSDDKPQDK
jgi:hypothetical protein